MEVAETKLAREHRLPSAASGHAALRWGVILPWNPELMPATTSGCEEEALFSIWKFTQGQAVYSDPAAVPYAISYFNWLFYWSYGAIAKMCLSVFHLPEIWLPAITRCIT